VYHFTIVLPFIYVPDAVVKQYVMLSPVAALAFDDSGGQWGGKQGMWGADRYGP